MTTATATTAADVAQTVRGYLRDRHPGGVTLDVIDGGVRLIDDWWRVPVRPSAEPPHTFEYYDVLAAAESEINDKAGLKVLLVPAMSEVK
ncbi:MAG: hypothetical protein JO250_15665 [Armatimonadetes bacterium]|nr:hypothetical protein [Armatimonadota bacterium]